MPVADLAGQHQQRAVQQLMHVHDLVRGPVQLGVLLGRADQAWRSGWSSPRSRSSAARSRPCSPASAAAPSRRRRRPTAAARPWSQPATSRPAATNVGASSQPSRAAVVVQPVGDRVLPVGRLQRGQRRRLRHPLGRLFLQPDQRLQARVRSYVPTAIMPSLCRMPGHPLAQRAVARTAAAAGLFSSWVSPADSEPSASSRSRWPMACCGVLDAEEQPLQQVHRHREPVVHQLRRTCPRPARRTATAR